MLRAMICKELVEMGRDPGTRFVLGSFVVLLSVSCLVSESSWTESRSVQEQRRQTARDEWLSQTTDSPHQATHHGTSVFQEFSPLIGVDSGIAREVGTTVRVEAHRRHAATDPPRANEIRLFRLDYTTPALLLQAVLPLVIVMVCHSMIARELGMFPLLRSLGVTRGRLLFGKFAAVLSTSLLLSTPLILHLLWIAATSGQDGSMTGSELAGRAGTLLAANLLYQAAWCVTGISVSARCPTAGLSLILLIACWSLWTLVLPRLAVDLASSRDPIPNSHALQEIRAAILRQGSDGQTTLKEWNERLERRVQREMGGHNATDLTTQLKAAQLIAMEEFTDAVDDRIQGQFEEIHRRQTEFMDRFAILSPYLAVRAISTALAGTDRHHQDAFVASVEQYRRQLVKTMNTAEFKGRRPGATEASRREFWSEVPEFLPNWPSLHQVLRSLGWPAVSLLVWGLCITILAVLPTREQFT